MFILRLSQCCILTFDRSSIRDFSNRIFRLCKHENSSRRLTVGNRSRESHAGRKDRPYEIMYTRYHQTERSVAVSQAEVIRAVKRFRKRLVSAQRGQGPVGIQQNLVANLQSQGSGYRITTWVRKSQYSSPPLVCVCVLRLSHTYSQFRPFE